MSLHALFPPQRVWQIGRYSVEMLPLAQFRMDGGGLFGVVPKVLWEKAYPHCDAQNRVNMAAFAMLVRGPGFNLVADAGLGDKLSPKLNNIFDVHQRERSLILALADRGISVNEITHFVFTHMHFDHAGGATEAGEDGRLRPVFPRAVHYVQAGHLAWANNPSDKDKASFDPQNWEAVVDAGLMRELEGEASPVPGVELRVVHGHTAGMQMVLVQDGDAGFLYSVDTFPTRAHLKPHYIPAFDNHPLATLEEKRALLEEAYERRWIIAPGHDMADGPFRVVKGLRGEFLAEPAEA